MRTKFVAASAVTLSSFLFWAPAKADTSGTPAEELAKEFAEMKHEFSATDEELLASFRKYLGVMRATRSVIEEKDFPVPTSEELRDIVSKMGESVQKMENTSMLFAVEALKFLNAEDVDGAKNYLRSTLAHQYSSAVVKNPTSEDLVLVRVRELTENDAVLDRLIQDKLKPQRERNAEPLDSPEIK
jgi:hypothetical protein